MSRTTKNWPSLNPNIAQRTWKFFMPKIVYLLSKIPFLRKRFRSLNEAMGHHFKASALEAPKPKDLDLKMLRVAFVDFLCVEDFPKLKLGLKKMQKKYRSSFRFRNTDDSFAQFERHEAGISGWMEFDSFLLANEKDHNNLAKELQIQLYWLSPSMLLLGLIITPTELFEKRLQENFLKEFSEKVIVPPSSIWSAFRNKSWRVTHFDSSRQRTIEHQKLMLELNFEISSSLRKNIGVGWSLSGPLPSVEIFTMNKGIFPEKDGSNRFFWHSIGIETTDFFTYLRDGVFLFKQDTDLLSKAPYSAHKILIDRNKFMQGKSIEGYRSAESALYHMIIYDHLIGYFIATGLREHLRRLVQQIAEIRKRIAPELTSEKSSLGKIWKNMSSNISHLNRLKFDVKRTGIDINLDTLRPHAVDDLKGFVSEWRPDKKIEFLDDLKFELKKNWEYANAQLESLRENYKDQFDLNMQRAILALTIITAILAFFSMPEWVHRAAFHKLHDAASIVISHTKSLLELIRYYLS